MESKRRTVISGLRKNPKISIVENFIQKHKVLGDWENNSRFCSKAEKGHSRQNGWLKSYRKRSNTCISLFHLFNGWG